MLKVSWGAMGWISHLTFCDEKQIILLLLAAREGLTCSSIVELIKKLDSHEEELGKMA